MKNVMLDLETMGTANNAAIVSIGACFFNIATGDIGDKFDCQVFLGNSSKYGEIDGNTVLWWLKQDDEARKKLNSPDAISLIEALGQFSNFIGGRNVCVWGNGASFDCVILRSAYNARSMDAPWPFYMERDVRTIVDLGRSILNFDPKADMLFSGVRHSAVDDAVHQSKYVSAIYQQLNNKRAA